MYGALIVLNAGDVFDPETDKIFLISQGGSGLYVPVVSNKNADMFGKDKLLLNGTNMPATLNLNKGKRYRFRVINIGAQNFGSQISIKQNDELVTWTLVAKDGMNLSKNQRQIKPSSQSVAIGETYDFEFTAAPGNYRIEIHRYARPINSKPEITQLIKIDE